MRVTAPIVLRRVNVVPPRRPDACCSSNDMVPSGLRLSVCFVESNPWTIDFDEFTEFRLGFPLIWAAAPRAGLTPNPRLRCRKDMKLDIAGKQEGLDSVFAHFATEPNLKDPRNALTRYAARWQSTLGMF